MIVDSNILIYAARPDDVGTKQWLAGNGLAYSSITRLEVLGFNGILPKEYGDLTDLMANLVQLPVSDDLIEDAILLRQARRMSLGDSIVAVTALALDMPLATANVRDFRNIPGLILVNPMPTNTAVR